MTDKVKAIVTFAFPWRMEDEINGTVREGLTVHYLMTDKLTPLTNEDGSKGYRLVQESINIQNVKQIVKVPGIYEMTYGYTIRRGKPMMKLQEIKFISEVGN
jgi:hypothetical protein